MFTSGGVGIATSEKTDRARGEHAIGLLTNGVGFRLTIHHWWKKEGERVIQEITKYTSFPWERKEIEIYFIAQPHKDTWVGGFSDPITLFLKKPKGHTPEEQPDIFLKTGITHELIHHNIPLEIIDPYLNEIQEKYSCNRIAATHCIIHAVLKKIFIEEELIFDKKICKNNESYNKAWKIVDDIGAENILSDFRKYVKQKK